MGVILHKKQNYSGVSPYKYVPITTANYNALPQSEKMDSTKVYFLIDAKVASARIDDTDTSTGKVWSSKKVSDEIDAVQDQVNDNTTDITTLNSKFSWQKVGEFTANGNVAVTSLTNCSEIMFVYVLSKPRVTLITLPLDVFKVTGMLADYMLYTTRCNFTAEYVNDTTISISSISSLANGSVYIYAR